MTLKNFLNDAFAISPRAKNLANSMQLFGASPNNVAQGILQKLETYGSDVDGRHILVLLIDKLKDQDAVGLEEGDFLARLVFKYRLIYPADPSKLSETNVPESYITKTLSFLDALEWTRRLNEILKQVCRIEIGDTRGSGFLVGPDLVLTNYHVLRKVIAGEAAPTDVVLRFDYTAEDGGVEMRLADHWQEDLSEYDPEEFRTLEPKEVALDKLDYALIRLNPRPDEGRGWVTSAQINPSYKFMESRALFIMQHPKGQPLKIALDTNAVLSVRQNGSRVRYRTNTEPGSSGSPCFDQNWNLVALHHSGDRNDAPEWNEGIPIKAILDLLTTRSKRNLIR